MLQGRVETDPAARKKIFGEFEKHITEMSPWIWLYTSNGYTVERENLEGFVPSPTGSLFSLSRVSVN